MTMKSGLLVAPAVAATLMLAGLTLGGLSLAGAASLRSLLRPWMTKGLRSSPITNVYAPPSTGQNLNAPPRT